MMDTALRDPQYATPNMPPPLPVDGSPGHRGAAETGDPLSHRKRRRLDGDTESYVGAAPSAFMQRVQTMVPDVDILLANAQEELLGVGRLMSPAGGDLLACSAKYTFQPVTGVQRLWTNDYGRGTLEWVRVAGSEKDMLPLPEWMDSRVELQVFIGDTMNITRRPHPSSSTRFLIPWFANIRFGRIPADCEMVSIMLTFVNPGEVTIKLAPRNNTDLGRINAAVVNLEGRTETDTPDVFHKAYCLVCFRTPLRRLLREQLRHVRGPVPAEANEYDAAHYAGADNVVLRKGSHWNMNVDRRTLVNISSTTARIFGESRQGKVSAYDPCLSKELLLKFIHAAAADSRCEVFPLDPSRLTPTGILELLKLASAWDFVPLKVWLQLTLMERLCEPDHGFNLSAVMETAKCLCRCCKDTTEELGIGQKMVLRGLLLMLRGVPQWTQLPVAMLEHPLLKGIVQPDFLPADSYIFVETMEGRKHNIKVNLAYWVGIVKAKLHDVQVVPVEQQELALDGKVLHDARTLADCKVKEGSVLQMKFIPL
ncbi:uncharacterized protein LOC129595894 [Paramacrobiotus metropolitanus]|uniref:uncharacterized protein LOC129595894 n=1 Tax=Paramacrobiotus metropolitanus TaxID=2943436 RepID=UPI0024456212|nr:uncharacterized protein LOC129595894 [Paramacrobiotus metropolitanus]